VLKLLSLGLLSLAVLGHAIKEWRLVLKTVMEGGTTTTKKERLIVQYIHTVSSKS